MKLIDRELWTEIFYNIRKNKLRTSLTAIGVFWGIFMLVILLGAGNGLFNATLDNFKASATNAIYVWPQRSSMPYKGFQSGRSFSFELEDVEHLKREVPEMEYIAPRISLGELKISTTKKEDNFNVQGEQPDMFIIESLDIIEGRKLNQNDLDNNKRVAVIGKRVAKRLNLTEAVGSYITIQGKEFLIVGQYEKAQTVGMRGGDPNENVYIPLSTAQSYLPIPNIFHWFVCTVDQKADIREVENKIKSVLKERHHIHPEDQSGVGSWNKGDFFMKFQNLFSGVKLFIWLVGIGSLIAGIVGVGNVMLISVKERTKEIGLRKALGATPKSLIKMVLYESLTITFLSGYLGLLCGTAIITLLEFSLNYFDIESEYFKRPEIDFTSAAISLVLIILAGIIAGIYPSRQAAKMDPVEALRNE